MPRSLFPVWYPTIRINKRCRVLSVDPKRKEFLVPDSLKKRYDFLSVYKSKHGTRIIPNIPGLPEIPSSGFLLEAAVLPLQGLNLPNLVLFP